MTPALAALTDVLRRQVEDTLRPLLAGARTVALLDYPNHPNVGDSAIWLGTLACLRALGIRRLCYTSDWFTYGSEPLRRRLGDGVILLCGGGSLGDLWPAHQRLREQVVRDFPANRIIQLPQSLHFGDAAALARARDVFDRHPNLLLLLRDRRGLEIARQEFRSPSALCPDMTVCLGALPRPAAPTRPIVWLARGDHESNAPSGHRLQRGVDSADWLREPVMALDLLNRLGRRAPEPFRRLPVLRALLSRTYEPVARRRLQRGCRTLSAGRAVVTDRLHGHILCLLLGIPHVLLDDRYGKIRAFYETWTHASPLVQWGEGADEALEAAQRMGRGLLSADCLRLPPLAKGD